MISLPHSEILKILKSLEGSEEVVEKANKRLEEIKKLRRG